MFNCSGERGGGCIGDNPEKPEKQEDFVVFVFSGRKRNDFPSGRSGRLRRGRGGEGSSWQLVPKSKEVSSTLQVSASWSLGYI